MTPFLLHLIYSNLTVYTKAQPVIKQTFVLSQAVCLDDVVELSA